MRLLSVNTGELTPIIHKGRELFTGIFKKPSAEPVVVLEQQLQYDQIANPKVHGGYHKAVYAYPVEHYQVWSQQYPHLDFDYGMFGENLTTEGLLESQVYVGDRLQIGKVILEISEPRQPCFKLGIKFQDDQIIKSFSRSGWTGFYMRIIDRGTLSSGQTIELIPGPRRITIKHLNDVLQNKPLPDQWWTTALQASELSEKWRQKLQNLLPK